MKQIKNIIAIVVMICSQLCVSVNNAKAANPAIGVQAVGGSIRYTLHIGTRLIIADTVLTDDSYVYTDKESSIAIADPKEQFHIGIVRKGIFTTERILQGNQKDAYTLANYLVYDTAAKTVEAIPFDYGYVTVNTSDTGVYKVSFIYTLTDKKTGELITLKGDAQFEVQSVVSCN